MSWLSEIVCPAVMLAARRLMQPGGRESREGGSWYAKPGGGSSELEAGDGAFIWAPVAGHSSGFAEGIPPSRQPPFVYFVSERRKEEILR